MEADVLAGEARSAVLLRISDVEIPAFPRRDAAEVLTEGFKCVGAADFEHHFILLNGLAFHSPDTFEGYHSVIAVFERPRIDIGIIRLLFPDLVNALLNVLVGDRRILVRHLDALIVFQLDFRRDFEFRLEPQGLAIVEMNVLDIGRAHDVQVFGLKLFLQISGNQVFEHLLPDVARKLLADQSGGGFAGTEAGQLGPLLNIGGDTAGFAFYFFGGNGNFQRMPATFEYSQMDLTSGKEVMV